MKNVMIALSAVLTLALAPAAFAHDDGSAVGGADAAKDAPKGAHHKTHTDHKHKHKKDCGHKAEKHGDHQDYQHDGHHHKNHKGHADECEGDGVDHSAEKAPEAPAHH